MAEVCRARGEEAPEPWCKGLQNPNHVTSRVGHPMQVVVDVKTGKTVTTQKVNAKTGDVKDIPKKETVAVNAKDVVTNWIAKVFTLDVLRKIAGVATTNASEGHHSSVSRKVPKNTNCAQGRALGCRQWCASMVHFEGEVWILENLLAPIWLEYGIVGLDGATPMAIANGSNHLLRVFTANDVLRAKDRAYHADLDVKRRANARKLQGTGKGKGTHAYLSSQALPQPELSELVAQPAAGL